MGNSTKLNASIYNACVTLTNATEGIVLVCNTSNKDDRIHRVICTGSIPKLALSLRDASVRGSRCINNKQGNTSWRRDYKDSEIYIKAYAFDFTEEFDKNVIRKAILKNQCSPKKVLELLRAKKQAEIAATKDRKKVPNKGKKAKKIDKRLANIAAKNPKLFKQFILNNEKLKSLVVTHLIKNL